MSDTDQYGSVEYEVRGIDHVAIAVTSLEDAVNWYTQSLGFRCVERKHTKGERTGMLSAVLAHNHLVVVLVQGTDSESQVSKFIEKFGPGVHHLALAVTNLRAVVAQVLAAGGGADTDIIEGEGIRQVFLRRDPASGVRVELIERNGGDFSDRTVEEIFRTFEAKDIY